ncbi:MAG: DUF4124 domain-containing protein [Desulfosarcina sp.]|nr:DUF4124 domain-containing protein [Desulfosarcina sp.]MBC2742915.1 DUF4124 domain-containing protein [Desulfosarcina sp.]MBC2765825.1 DUF4124 domain-containing protein [Desulfosarcina sp.]
MKKPTLAFFLIVTLVLAAPVCAEIYKYIDENGQKRWTDDLSQVPKEQRTSVQRFESAEEMPADAVADQTEQAPPESPLETETEVPDTDEPSETAGLSREALEKEKADLDTQYQQLLEERKQLEQIKPEAVSASTRAELNARISAYNSKTEQYETQLNAFNEKISAYNQKIRGAEKTN